MAKLVDVGSIASYFGSLDDSRHSRNRKHLLVDIAVIAVCAIIRGRDGPTAIHRWAKHRLGCSPFFGPFQMEVFLNESSHLFCLD
jgi:DDE_Tnp_1-associated